MSRAKEFWQCTNVKYNGKAWNIDCKLDLWGVSAFTRMEAEKEAFNYWKQYADDGEYSSIIGGKTVAEKLKEQINQEGNTHE